MCCSFFFLSRGIPELVLIFENKCRQVHGALQDLGAGNTVAVSFFFVFLPPSLPLPPSTFPI